MAGDFLQISRLFQVLKGQCAVHRNNWHIFVNLSQFSTGCTTKTLRLILGCLLHRNALILCTDIWQICCTQKNQHGSD